ncbi:MAG: HDOD domain-containing protein [Gammaproteobacteria bacterium]|nr:HDOD domain-containing protein [Gammaproteobacteria bacterium]
MVAAVDNKLFMFVESMPAFPKSVQSILKLAGDNQSSAKDFVQIIECDPVMTVKILKIINSPYYGLPHKINSIMRAVVHLGINTVKNMALAIAAIGVLKPDKKSGLNANGFLMHSLTTALITKLLAERQGLSPNKCSDYFVTGLLHDFGKLVFAQCLPESFSNALMESRKRSVSLHLMEREYLGIDHARLGKLLIDKWCFSEDIGAAIEHHHDEDGSDVLRDSVAVANQISKILRFGDGGNPVIDKYSEAQFSLFGLSLEELIVSLGDLSTIRTEALMMISCK